MDRLKREGNPPVGQLASPIPQYKRPGSTDYEAVEGQHGAPFAILKDASGNIVSPATDAKLEQVRQLLTGVATENKLEQARVLLDTISTKDFATSSNQDALKTVVDDLKSELLLVKSELATIKANQLSGDQKVQLSGKMVAEGEIRETLVDNNDIYVSELIDCRNATDLVVTLGMNGDGARMVMDIIWYGADRLLEYGFEAYLEEDVLEDRKGVNPWRGFGARRLKTKGKYFRIRITGSATGERGARCGWLLQ